MELKVFVLISALFSASESYRKDRNKAGLILLHGLGISLGPNEICQSFARSSMMGLGLSEDTLVRCPKAKRRPVGVLPPTFVPGMQFARSWFNFNLMPALSVVSPVPGEDKQELMAALQVVEEEIQDLMRLGVPSENIVVGGLSQGGALTLWTAIHTRYKLGGFIPMVTWLPRAKVEPPKSLPFWPVNRDTPILHMNGMADMIVPVYPAGKKTEEAMKEVFTHYTFKAIPLTTHMTTAPNPMTMPILKKWLKANTNLKFKNSFTQILNPVESISKVSDQFFGGFGGFGGFGR